MKMMWDLTKISTTRYHPSEAIATRQGQWAEFILPLDWLHHEAYRTSVGGVNAPREYGSSGGRARGRCAGPACTGKPKLLPRSPPYL